MKTAQPYHSLRYWKQVQLGCGWQVGKLISTTWRNKVNIGHCQLLALLNQNKVSELTSYMWFLWCIQGQQDLSAVLIDFNLQYSYFIIPCCLWFSYKRPCTGKFLLFIYTMLLLRHLIKGQLYYIIYRYNKENGPCLRQLQSVWQVQQVNTGDK